KLARKSRKMPRPLRFDYTAVAPSARTPRGTAPRVCSAKAHTLGAVLVRSGAVLVRSWSGPGNPTRGVRCESAHPGFGRTFSDARRAKSHYTSGRIHGCGHSQGRSRAAGVG